MPLIHEGPNRRLRQPWIVYAVVLCCTIVLILTRSDLHSAVHSFGYSPRGDAFPGMLTSLFLHANFFHLLGNMLFLYIFGDNVEDVLGSFRFAGAFLLAGLCGNLGYHLVHSQSPTIAIGASGAVSGIMGMYFLLFPAVRSQLTLAGSGQRVTIPMSMPWALSIWFGYQAFLMIILEFDNIIPVAFSAHVTAFLCGLGMGWLARKRGLLDQHRLRLVREKTTHEEVICPACYHETPAAGYGRYVCSHCRTEFLFERTGIRILNQF